MNELSKKHGFDIPENWNIGKRNLICKIRNSLVDIFKGTDYDIRFNTSKSDKDNLIDIFRTGEAGRCAFLAPSCTNADIRFAVKKELIPKINLEVKLPNPDEIKPGRYPNWSIFNSLDFDTVYKVCQALTK